MKEYAIKVVKFANKYFHKFATDNQSVMFNVCPRYVYVRPYRLEYGITDDKKVFEIYTYSDYTFEKGFMNSNVKLYNKLLEDFESELKQAFPELVYKIERTNPSIHEDRFISCNTMIYDK